MAGALLGSLFTSFAGEAVKNMPAVVADVYTTVSHLIPAAPTSSAEVAVAAIAQKAMPAVTATELSMVKNVYGKAVAEYVTINPNAKLEDPAVWPALQALADSGITAYGLNTAQMPPQLKSQLLSSAILVYQAGMGVAAISVTKL